VGESRKEPEREKERERERESKAGRPAAQTDTGRKRSRTTAGPQHFTVAAGAPPDAEEVPKSYRVNSSGVLLTYHGFQDLEQWVRFLAFVKSNLRAWKVKHWCATLERTTAGRLHVHVMFQFTKKHDHPTSRYTFEGLRAGAEGNDLLGEGWCRKKLQESFDRAFFYCWADKIGQVYNAEGTACTEGNYAPAWTGSLYNYAVRWKWPHNLWWKYKLTDEVYDSYLFLCKDGSEGRKRYLDQWRERKNAEAERIQPFSKYLLGVALSPVRERGETPTGPSRNHGPAWAQKVPVGPNGPTGP